MKRCRNTALALWLGMVFLPFAAKAIGEAENETASIEAIGAGRVLGAYFHYPDIELLYPDGDDGLAAAVLRIIIEGDLGEYVDYEVNFYNDFSRTPGSALAGAFSTVSSFRTPYRTKYLSWDYWQDGSINSQLGLDRLKVHFGYDPVSLTVGRFPINHSVTYIFTPNDFFAPFSSTSINKMYKPGVDALSLSIAPGMLSTIELVGVMGYGSDDVPAWGRSALLLRASTVLWNFEWALMGGKLAERWITGASIQGEAGPFGLRAEGHAGFPDREGTGSLDDVDGDEETTDDIHGRLAAGFDVMFDWHNASIGAEYAFFSDGAGSPSSYLERAMRFFPDDQFYLAGHYAGVSLGGDIVPILRANAVVLFNAIDYSGMGMVSLIYNIADEADFVGGVMIPWGNQSVTVSAPPEAGVTLGSEFGIMPLTVFLETRFYF